jgi:ABC-2 type transport system ATP-binding protein
MRGLSLVEHAIVTEGLRKSFKALAVLDGIDLAVGRGTILGLLGPNGAGKTTTVRILSTLLRPDGGRALVNGYDVVRQTDQVRHSIGLTGQYAAVDELLTGYENLHLMGRLYRLRDADAKRRAHELLEELDLIEAANRQVRTYSGGMRRRLDLAASLVAYAPIVFLDEPTTGLDPRSRLALWQTIRSLVETGSTILLTTQYLDEADQLADKVAVLDAGHIIAEGTADELKERVGSERAELVFADDNDFDTARRALDAQPSDDDRRRRTLSMPIEGGVRQLKQLLDRLEADRVEPEGLSLHRPTLDDVFLSLTGHQATATDAEDGVAPGAGSKNR